MVKLKVRNCRTPWIWFNHGARMFIKFALFFNKTVINVCNLILQIFNGGNIVNNFRPPMHENVGILFESSISNFWQYAEQWDHADKNKLLA